MNSKPDTKVVRAEHCYAGLVELPKISFGDEETVQAIQVWLAIPTSNNMQIMDLQIGMRNSPFSREELSEQDAERMALIFCKKPEDISFEDFTTARLLSDSSEDRLKFDQVFATRGMGHSIKI